MVNLQAMHTYTMLTTPKNDMFAWRGVSCIFWTCERIDTIECVLQRMCVRMLCGCVWIMMVSDEHDGAWWWGVYEWVL